MATAKTFSPFFSTATDQFIELRRTELRPSTVHRFYQPSFRSFLSIIPDRPVQQYSQLDLAIYQQARLQKASGATLNINLRALRSLGHWLAFMEILPEKNCFTKIRLLRIEDKPVRFLTPEEFTSILKAEESATLRSIYQLAVLTGFRLSQLLNLQWSQIDFSKGTIVLTSEFSKNRKTTLLPLNSKAIEILRKLYRPFQVYVFQKPRGCLPTPYSASYVSHSFKQTAVKAEIGEVSFHTLRKTFGSWLISASVPIYAVSRLLTHSSVAVTERHYLGLGVEDMKEAVNRLNQLQ